MWSGYVAQIDWFIFGCSQRMLSNDQCERKVLRAESWAKIYLYCILEIDTMLSNTIPIILGLFFPPLSIILKFVYLFVESC